MKAGRTGPVVAFAFPALCSAPGTRPGRRPRLGPAGIVAVAGGYGRPVPVGPGGIGLGQQLLFGGRAGRDQELEGVFLRLIRLVELHNRRQTSGRPLGYGDIGPDFRPLFVEHPRPPGPGRGGGGGRPVRHRAALGVRRSGADSGDRHGVHACGGVDVPVQQPRRFAGPLAVRRRLRHDLAIEKSSTRWLIFAFSLVGLGFITKMMQAFLVVPGWPTPTSGPLPFALARRVRQLAAAGARHGGVGRVVGGGGHGSRRRPTVRI